MTSLPFYVIECDKQIIETAAFYKMVLNCIKYFCTMHFKIKSIGNTFVAQAEKYVSIFHDFSMFLEHILKWQN